MEGPGFQLRSQANHQGSDELGCREGWREGGWWCREVFLRKGPVLPLTSHTSPRHTPCSHSPLPDVVSLLPGQYEDQRADPSPHCLGTLVPSPGPAQTK